MVERSKESHGTSPVRIGSLIGMGVVTAALALFYAMKQQPTSDSVGDTKPDVAKKVPAEPRNDGETGIGTERPELTPLQKKLGVLDRTVYELGKDPEPDRLFPMIKEFQALCDELLGSDDTSDEVKMKVRVLQEAIDLYEQLERGPQTDRDGLLETLGELNKDGRLNDMIAKLKTMAPEEFAAHQESEFAKSVEDSLANLLKALETRQTIGRDEHELVRSALYRSKFPKSFTAQRRRSEAIELAEDFWLANFPPERRDAWRRASQEHAKAILKTLDDPNAKVPEMPEHLRDIDDPYAQERQAEQEERRRQFDEERKQHEEIQRSLQRLIDQMKLGSGESDLIEQELRKARERRDDESEPKMQLQR